MNFKAIPLLLVLAMMVVPLSQIPVYATDSPLSMGNAYPLNSGASDPITAWGDTVGSEEDGVHWVWIENPEGAGVPEEIKYQYSASGEDHSSILIRDFDDPLNDEFYRSPTLLVDGTDVYVFYVYYDADFATTGSDYYMAMKKSTNNGISFGSEIIVVPDANDFSGNYKFVTVPEQDATTGDLYVFFKCECDSEETTIGLVLSTDGGATWDQKTDVGGLSSEDTYEYDPYFTKDGIYIDDGVIQITWEGYYNDDYYSVFYNVSEDKGDSWAFGYLDDDEEQLTPLDYDDEDSSDYASKIFVAGSQTTVLWCMQGDMAMDRTSDLGQSWEYGANDFSNIGISCSDDSDIDWDAVQLGSFIAVMAYGGYDEPLEMITSPNLGDNWSSVDTVLADAGTIDDLFQGVHADANGNNIAFTFVHELEDDEDWLTYIFYAQEPTGFSDFVLQQMHLHNGVEPSFADYLPHATLTGDSIFHTWFESGISSAFWHEAELLNSGFVPDDQTPPVIVSQTSQPITIYVNEAFEPLNYATCTDDVDGDLTNSIMVEVNGVDTSKTGVYTVTFECIDMAMNLADPDYIEFFVKKKSGGSGGSGSFSSGTSSQFGQQNTLETLEDVKPLIEIKLEEQKDLSTMFADIFKSRLGADDGVPQSLSIVPDCQGNACPTGQNPFGTQTSGAGDVSYAGQVTKFFNDIFSLFNLF